MAFCYKCGKELDPDSVFCPACGANQKAADEAPASPEVPASPKASDAPATPIKTDSIPFAVPSMKKLIAIGATFIAFLFSVIFNWWKVSYSGYGLSYSEGFSIFHSNMFSLNFFMGFAKIFAILSVIAFIVYAVSAFVDLSKFVKLPFDVKKMSKLAYFGTLAAALLFALIGIIIEEFVGISFGWFIILIFGAVAAVLEFTDIFSKYFPNIK